MERYFNHEKLVLTGNPIRKDILNFNNKKNLAKEFFNIDKTKKTVLVIGGSLGARTINNAIINNLNNIKESKINLIWQTGELFYPTAKESINQLKCTRLKTYDFIKKGFSHTVADVIISRAEQSQYLNYVALGNQLY